MLARTLRTEPRPLEEIRRLIEAYPEYWRRWCASPERGGCACSGCVRQPAPSTVRGDPEYAAWPNEADALNELEVQMYLAEYGPMPPPANMVHGLHIRFRPGRESSWPAFWSHAADFVPDEDDRFPQD